MRRLTVTKTAARFGVSRQRVLRWINASRLKATWEHGGPGPNGGRYLISERAARPIPIRPERRKSA